MSRFQSKSTHHTKTHEELKLNEERQSKDANTKRTGLLELHDKDFKVAMITMLQQAITNAPKANEKIESLSKEIEYMRKNQKFGTEKYSN